MMTIAESIDRFLGHVRALQTLGTAKTYATGLAHFGHYLGALEPPLPPESTEVSQLSLPLAQDYITWLYDYLLEETADGDPERISEATKATYLAAISRYFEYLIVESQALSMSLEDYDKLKKAIARTTRYTARAELPPDKLPSLAIVEALREEARKPLDLRDDLPEGERRRKELARLRNMAMVEALVSSGMRVSELARLRRGHLLPEEMGAILKHTKGKKEREVLFSPEAWEAMQTYLAERRDGAQRRPSDLPVFARHNRGAGDKVLPLSTRSIQNVFAELAERADISERFHLTPHTLRHFFATEFLSQTGNLALTQYALGHASPNTTRIYAQTRRQDFRRAHRQVFQKPQD